MSAGTTLAELEARGLGKVTAGDPATVVRGVRHDSREVEPGDLFVAISGLTNDGTKYAAAALERGASALAAESALPLDAPTLVVRDARRALAALSAIVYGDPTARLSVVGLTGTNGKTTTAWVIDEALTHLGQRPALLSTIETRTPTHREAAPFTTPEGDAIARFAQRALDEGADHLVMEVSSHALALHRADAVHFSVAGFTNLTRDHLDFHASMEDYFAAKARLFEDLAPRAAVINVDDPAGAKLAEACRVPLVLCVSREGRADADVRAASCEMTRDGLRAEIDVLAERVTLASPMIGLHNLDNLMLALGVLHALGHSPRAAADALGRAKGAPGRLERVDGLDGVSVVVDYAHTPDALARALDALRPVTAGRLIVVFGCGGDRDREKRPEMGRAAGERADLAIVTSDNPRTEDPHAILSAIEPGIAAHLKRGPSGYEIVEDRRAAIRRAIERARPGDTVLIAGKGHEDYQIRGREKLHFDDREEARSAIAARLGGEA
ncbi:MAG: UDP-N-acetylmuramoyl-L-alanyl-D-glutamate--2,6-diaminopimelate ligase [Sandaracinaceae bacterium]